MVQRILFVRLSAIGDLIFAAPVASAFRAHYPGAHLSWLVDESLMPVLQGHPALDEVIGLPLQRWRRDWRQGRRLGVLREAWAWRRRLRDGRFDWAIDLQGLLKSGLWAWLSGAPRRTGLGSREGSQRLMTEVIARPSDGISDGPLMASEHRELLRVLGLEVPSPFGQTLASPSALARQQERALGLGLTSHWVIAPFTTRNQKHWPWAHWQSLLAELRERGAPPVVILGGPADQTQAEALAAPHPGWAHALAGQTRLDEAMAWVERADAVIGVDTGLTHLGFAAGRPTLALFGSTRPYSQPDEGQSGLILWLGLECSPCHRRPSCGGREIGSFACLADIPPERVLGALDHLGLLP